ncbi:MAG: hypothetical protein JWM28_2243 [Chitinophagaceae bacterium]|nr:hypothetical protein [Chitinophagaceae bacterium]
MNPVKIFFPALFLLAINGRSQESDKASTADIFKVTFFNPGISYEKGIGKFQTLYAQAFLNTSFSLGYSSSPGNYFKFIF